MYLVSVFVVRIAAATFIETAEAVFVEVVHIEVFVAVEVFVEVESRIVLGFEFSEVYRLFGSIAFFLGKQRSVM